MGTTAVYGIEYADSTDAAQVWITDKAQADSIEAALVAALDTPWTAVGSPTWTSTGTAPVLGNGTLLVKYRVVAGVKHMMLRLTWGSTTTGGTGTWRFGGWPSAVDRTLTNLDITGMAYDTSAGTPYPVAGIMSANTDPAITRLGSWSATGVVGQVQVSVPFTWANGDILTVSGSWE